jgi:hypothetical protein
VIHEYALEPELVATWTDRLQARYFTESFGLGQPRLVSRYPKRWRQLVWDAFHRSAPHSTDMQRKRMEELIAHLDAKTVRRDGALFDSHQPWLENAEREHDRKPFQAILARTNPRGRGEVLVGEDLEEGRSSARWAVARGATVPRQARDMAGAVRSMLCCCREVIFIDPHFGPESARYRRSLEAFLEVLIDGRAGTETLKVQVHTGVTATAVFFKDTCERELGRHIPAGLRVEFRRWVPRTGGEILHNRYILTELGGVIFAHGLDQGNSGETDDVNLLDREQYVRRWEQYLGDAPAFDLAEEPVIVVGTKPPRR